MSIPLPLALLHVQVHETGRDSTRRLVSFIQLSVAKKKFYLVVSAIANHAWSVLFSYQYTCKSCLVSFIQLSVQLQITPCQFYSVVSTIANHNSASKLKNCSSVSQVLFSSVYL